MDDYLKVNKNHWNKVTSVHAASKFYDVESFKKGKTNPSFVELEEVGNVEGRTFLHLQCHFGIGTLSWARKGAIATGVDLSDESIKLARQLSKEIGVNADFICSDIYSLTEVLDNKFDIVFTSYGVLCWLPDLKKWAELINHFLKPGGMFYIVDDHPLMGIFNHEFNVAYSYFAKEPFIEESLGSYADRSADLKTATHQWNHTMSDIVNSLLEQGLRIKFIHEFPFSVWEPFPRLIEKDNQGLYRFKDKNIQIPLLFSIKAIKR